MRKVIVIHEENHKLNDPDSFTFVALFKGFSKTNNNSI